MARDNVIFANHCYSNGIEAFGAGVFSGANLIFKNNEVLSVDNVKKLYTLLNSDLSDQFEDSPLEIIRLAAQKCHIGQAVDVKYGNDIESAVLRISLGARVISDSWVNRDISLFFRNIEAQMSQITIIIKKIELILTNPELLN